MHEAHINIPLQLKDDYNLERIIFVPTGTSPVGKTFRATSSDRVAMLINATKRHSFFDVSEHEWFIRPSFSIDTVKYFKKKFNNSRIRLLIGEDNLTGFNNWFKYEQILLIANIIVLARNDVPKYGSIESLNKYVEKDIDSFNRAEANKIHFSVKYKIDISSTMIRKNLLENKSIQEYVCNEVYQYIKERFIQMILNDEISLLLEEYKAENVIKLDVKDKSSVTDTMIIASGRSTSAKSIADNIIKKLKKIKLSHLVLRVILNRVGTHRFW